MILIGSPLGAYVREVFMLSIIFVILFLRFILSFFGTCVRILESFYGVSTML